MTKVLESLLSSDDPCVRYRALVDGCGVSGELPQARREQEAIRSSSRAKSLLSTRDESGRIRGYVYAKYTGAHWVLADLADMGYPSGDSSLAPVADQVQELWLSPSQTKERVVDGESARYKSKPGIPIIDGCAGRCASQEGNALYAILALGLADELGLPSRAPRSTLGASSLPGHSRHGPAADRAPAIMIVQPLGCGSSRFLTISALSLDTSWHGTHIG